MKPMLSMAAALTLFVPFAGCGDSDIFSNESHVTSAQTYLDKGKYQSAVIELKNALTENPNNMRARWLLGEAYMQLGDAQAAEKELRRAMQLGVSGDSVLPELAEALLLQRDFDGLLSLEQPADLAPESQARILAAQGLAHLEKQNWEEASRLFESALKRDASLVEAVHGKAALAVKLDKRDEARQLLDDAFKLDGEYAPAWSLLGDIEQSEGNLDAALKAYGSAIDKRRNNQNDILSRAYVYLIKQDYGKASADIANLKELFSGHPSVNHFEGLVLFQQQKYETALEAFDRALSVDQHHMPSLLYAGACRVFLGQQETARSNLTRFHQAYPDHVPVRKMLAHLALGDGNFQEVQRLLGPVVKQEPDDIFSLNLLSTALMGERKPEEGVAHLRKVVDLRSDSAAARMNLGIGLIMGGYLAPGIAELEKSRDLAADPSVPYAKLIELHLRNGKLDKALEEAIAFTERHPASLNAQVLLAAVYLQRGEKDEARSAFVALLEQDPGNVTAHSGLAGLALQDKDFERARDHYRSILNIRPGKVETWLNLALVDAASGNIPGVEETLTAAIEANPDALSIRLWLSKFRLQQGMPQAALNLLSPLRDEYPNHVVLLTTLGQARMALRDFRPAKVDFQKAEDLAPDNARVVWLRGQTHRALRETGEYRRALERSLALDANMVEARLELVELLLQEGDPQGAEGHLEQLASLAPDDAAVLVLRGRLAQERGDLAKAVKAYQGAFEQAPNNYNLSRLSYVEWESGQRAAAVSRLESWLSNHPNDRLVLMELAGRYMTLGKDEDATATFTRVLEIDDNNIRALNNLAWLLREPDPGRALQYAEKAASLAPSAAEILDTLAMVLLENRDLEKSLDTIQRALELKPNDPTMVFHKAQILAAAGEARSAEGELAGLLERAMDFPERASAQRLLDNLRNR